MKSSISNTDKIKKVLAIILGILAAISVFKGVINAVQSSVDFLYDDFRSAVFQHNYLNAQFPFTFWMMFFFAFLSREMAIKTWIICNLFFTAGIIILIKKTFLKEMSGIDYCILSFFMISGGAWRTNISNGQYKLLFMLCFLMAVMLSDEDRDIAAGFFLSMSAFQYTLAAPLGVYFLFKRKYKVIISAASFLAVSFIGTAVWFGGIRNITLRQLEFSRMLTEDGDVDIQSLLGLGNYVIPVFLAGVLFLVIIAYAVKWRPGDDALFISVALMTAYAVAYQRIYSFFILIIPLGLLWMMVKEDPEDKLVIADFCLMLLLTLSFFYSRTIISETAGMMISRVLFYPSYVILLFIAFRRNKL